MARPMGALRRKFLESCSSGGVSCFEIAQRTGLPRSDLERVASNALRSGDVVAAGTRRLEGSDRPVLLYAPPSASHHARDAGWWSGLQGMARLG